MPDQHAGTDGTTASGPAEASGATAPGEPRVSRRALVRFAIRFAVGVGLLVLFASVVDFRAALAAVADIDPGLALAGFVASVVATILIPAVITRQTLVAVGLRLRWHELVLINFGMRFYNLMLPQAISVGLRWQRYRTDPGTGWQAATLILFERFVQLMMVMIAGFGFLALAGPEVPTELAILVPLSALGAVAATSVVLTFVWAPAFRVVDPVLRWLQDHTPDAVARRLERLRSAIRDFHGMSSARVGAVIGLAAGAHLLVVLSSWFVARGLAIDVSFATVGWMRSVVFVVTVLPITVGGLGVREVGFATLLRLQGIDAVGAASFPLVLLAYAVATGFIGGIAEGVRAIRVARSSP